MTLIRNSVIIGMVLAVLIVSNVVAIIINKRFKERLIAFVENSNLDTNGDVDKELSDLQLGFHILRRWFSLDYQIGG